MPSFAKSVFFSSMTAAIEVAAGAFAAIGVADVAIRTGHEVYKFLRDISDAPIEIDKLHASVKETTQLAEAAKECLVQLCKQTDTAHGAAESLHAALKSLYRELHSLRLLASRLKGSDTSWSRVKYVLDKRKISKSVDTIERTKTLLAGALVIVSRELSAMDHRVTVHLIRSCSDVLEEKANNLTHSMSNKLREQHQEAVRKHSSHMKASKAIQKTQAKILCQQAEISAAVKNSQTKSRIEHRKTRKVICTALEDMVSTRMAKLEAPSSGKKRLSIASGRDIYFFGERRDMIMAYLLLVKAQLEVLFRHFLPYPCEPTLARHAGWLQSEFEHLVASAAHEASAHSAASCESPDQWYYSHGATFSAKSGSFNNKEDSMGTDSRDTKIEILAPPSTYLQPRSTQQTFTHETTFGHLRVHLPSADKKSKETKDEKETGFVLTCGIGQSVHVISGRFFRNVVYTHGVNSLCAQLNVFTLVESENLYAELFSEGTVEEIDTALRQGIISPYHVNREERIMCLYWAAEYARKDLLGYFDTQGIGVANLNHDSSLVAGFFRKAIKNDEKPKLEASVDFVLNRVYDYSYFLTEMTMGMLLWDYYKRRPRSLIQPHLSRLRKEGLLSLPTPITETDETTPWDWPTVFAILRPLVSMGAYADTTGSIGRNVIQRTFGALVDQDGKEPGDPKAVEEIVTALIAAGVDIHHRDNDGVTPSMYARRHGRWNEWGHALKRNGMCVETVIAKDECNWLLRDDWREVWNKKFRAS